MKKFKDLKVGDYIYWLDKGTKIHSDKITNIWQDPGLCSFRTSKFCDAVGHAEESFSFAYTDCSSSKPVCSGRLFATNKNLLLDHLIWGAQQKINKLQKDISSYTSQYFESN